MCETFIWMLTRGSPSVAASMLAVNARFCRATSLPENVRKTFFLFIFFSDERMNFLWGGGVDPGRIPQMSHVLFPCPLVLDVLVPAYVGQQMELVNNRRPL